MTSAQTRYLSSSLPVRYVLLFVNHLKYCLNPTRKKSFNKFLVLLRFPPRKVQVLDFANWQRAQYVGSELERGEFER